MNTIMTKMLQKAHAGEIAAYLAYEGHWRSLKDPKEREEVRAIQADELHHKEIVRELLTKLGAKPSWVRDTVFTVIGRTMSALCYVTGWYMPMLGALLIERIGVNNYAKMANMTKSKGMRQDLLYMHRVELAHEIYFMNKVSKEKCKCTYNVHLNGCVSHGVNPECKALHGP